MATLARRAQTVGLGLVFCEVGPLFCLFAPAALLGRRQTCFYRLRL
jgi:hypothetical protein